MMHVFRYGRDHGRIYFVCRKPQQDGKRCRFRSYLDEQDFQMPKCQCQPPEKMVLRRVMGLVDTGRYFAQCATKRCKRRVWIAPAKNAPDIPELALMSQAGAEEDAQSARWNRHRRIIPASQESTQSEPCARLFVQRSATGEFVHGREGVAQLSKHLLGIPDKKGVVHTPSSTNREESCGSGTCTPVTSGAEELLEDEEESNRPPPDLTICYEKRWSRQISPKVLADCEREEPEDSRVAVKFAVMDIFPSASSVFVDDLLAEGMSLEQIVDCLSTPDSSNLFA